MNLSLSFRRAARVSAVLLPFVFPCSSSALTISEAYTLKGSGKVAAELLAMAAGAPRSGLVVSALAQPGQAERLLADLKVLGLEHGAWAGRLVTGRLPFSAVRHLDLFASLHSIRPSHALFQAASDPDSGQQGFTVSQGDKEMYAAAARTRFQVDGTGVKVGVVSNSYNCFSGGTYLGGDSGAVGSIASGDLPTDVQVLADLELTLPAGQTQIDPTGRDNCMTSFAGIVRDEGRAMLEVIHDLAPGAALAFHTSGRGEVDMANGIRMLADAGATVIVDDTVYLDEPVYQDGGPIVDAVKYVVTLGVSYIAAAGNFGRQTYEAPFRSSGEIQAIQGRTVELHDFDPGPSVDTCQQVTLYGGGIALALHWDQPYASISNGPGASSDLDLFLMDSNCQQVYQVPASHGFLGQIGVAATANIGGDPVETLSIASDVDKFTMATFGIAIGQAAGAAPDRLRISYAGGTTIQATSVYETPYIERINGPREATEYTAEGPTLFGHANQPESITVGAVRAQLRRQYQYGIAGDELRDLGSRPTELFSALGGTEILFDGQGNLLAQPIQRHKPDVAGEDWVDNRMYGEGLKFNGQPYSVATFLGTSAAAAHVGGLVALARQAAPGAAPVRIAEALRQTAQDLDDTLTPAFDTGFDFATGYGLADGENLIARLLSQPETSRSKDVPKSVADICGTPTATLHPGAKYRGTQGNDVVKGAEGNEKIRGLKGDDKLCGEADGDRLWGGPGSDVLDGGPGNDMLRGGPGADVFRFAGAGTGQDRIMDLGRGDTIEIVRRDANGDGQVDATDVLVGNLAEGGTVITFRDRSGDRIVIRGRMAPRVIQALRFLP
jgi:hypothetical protein